MRMTSTLALIAGLAVAGCASSSPSTDRSGPPASPAAVGVLPGAAPVDLAGLEHVAELTPDLISGGEPQGRAGYETLRAMGVKTVISVDAVPPPAELAREMGIRVVHLPIGYDGVPESTRVAMAKALTELEGPVYVHCHHGKHRGPAALVAGAVCSGEIDTARAAEFMTLTGTSKSYAGLWADVASAAPIDPVVLYTTEVDLPERADVGGYAGAMSLISRANDRVKLVAANNWQVPADHPDLAPGSDLGLIHNLLRSLADDAESIAFGAEHQRLLENSVRWSSEAERAFNAGDLAAAGVAFKELGASCKACHVAYRD